MTTVGVKGLTKTSCWLVYCVDQIAIPDFPSGAMENWGLVTYRETNLLYNDSVSSPSDKQRIAYVVAHELAHMVLLVAQFTLVSIYLLHFPIKIYLIFFGHWRQTTVSAELLAMDKFTVH